VEELRQFIWRTRYRDPHADEAGIADSWTRVATAVAAHEADPGLWRERFRGILQDYRFLPGGRILAGAGTSLRVTLFNCFVMGIIDDSIDGIFQALREGALTMQQGGGVGYDFSSLRPRGSRAATTGATASGPVSFMTVWDAMCATIQSTGSRRGAMMATLRCDHPDIEEFIAAKQSPGTLSHFNLSVLVTDAFMQAVTADAAWPLVFPEQALQPEGSMQGERVRRAWSGSAAAVACRVQRVVGARALWQSLCNSAFDCAEPGVLFIDRINAANNLAYCETLSATNPCAEEPLPPYGTCNLGSLNLTAFVSDAFTPQAALDYGAIAVTTGLAVRFLDNVIDISHFPLAQQREQAQRSRRIGLGITGLADALAMLRLRYDSEEARQLAARLMCVVRDAAYAASMELGRERGPFPAFDAQLYAARPFIQSLPATIQSAIRRDGIRNSHLTAIAPAGSISLLAGNVSSGIEPIYALQAQRRILDRDGTQRDLDVSDHAYALWREGHRDQAQAPDYFLEHDAVAPADHLLMQAALQPYVDSAISKTITLGGDCQREEVQQIFRSAYDLGLKGCTVYRPAARPGVIAGCRLPTGPAAT
jgi:ribonucleoside-diphosphate reductase alpha chain